MDLENLKSQTKRIKKMVKTIQHLENTLNRFSTEPCKQEEIVEELKVYQGDSACLCAANNRLFGRIIDVRLLVEKQIEAKKRKIS